MAPQVRRRKLPAIVAGLTMAMAGLVAAQGPGGRTPYGDITIAQPKIWQFERISVLLDGLLRDIEGVSMPDLTKLDARAENAAVIQFIQTAMDTVAAAEVGMALSTSDQWSRPYWNRGDLHFEERVLIG
jgi:hypothetical protein